MNDVVDKSNDLVVFSWFFCLIIDGSYDIITIISVRKEKGDSYGRVHLS